MTFAQRIAALVWTLDFGGRPKTVAELNRFARATEQFAWQLLAEGPPTNWRERLTAHLEFWRREGPGFKLANQDVLENCIVEWIAAQRPKIASNWRGDIAGGAEVGHSNDVRQREQSTKSEPPSQHLQRPPRISDRYPKRRAVEARRQPSRKMLHHRAQLQIANSKGAGRRSHQAVVRGKTR